MKRFSEFWNKRDKPMKEELKDQLDQADTIKKMNKESEEGKEQASGPEIVIDSTDSQEEINIEFGSMDDAVEAIASLQTRLRDAHAERDEHKDKLLRLQAEFVNFRKRKEKETTDSIRFANQELLKNLLPILDNFDRTLDAIEKTDNLTAIKDGITLVGNSMKKTFTKIGLEPIESTGKEFDTEYHEAVTSIPVEEEDQKGKVVDTIEKGYKLKDRVIRFSKVVVGE